MILVFILICLAILICLERSFWLTQQGFSPTEGFNGTWATHIKGNHVLLDQKVEDYLKLKGSNDWFTMKHSPSYDECCELQKIVVDNLLRKAGHFILQACVADIISSAQSTEMPHPNSILWYLSK